jgi:hypothetical protein
MVVPAVKLLQLLPLPLRTSVDFSTKA